MQLFVYFAALTFERFALWVFQIIIFDYFLHYSIGTNVAISLLQ